MNLPLSYGDYGSALIAAAFVSTMNMVKRLVEHGAEVDAIPKTGKFGSALAAAAAAIPPPWGTVGDKRPKTEVLIEAGADVNLLLPTGLYGSALIAAATQDIATCRHLVEGGADVHLCVPHGCYGSPLIAAMQSRSDEVVRFFLDQGVEVDHIPDGEGVVFGTALIAGAYWGFKEGVQMLLEAGAQVNLRTEVGRFRTALVAAKADLTDEGEFFEQPPWWFQDKELGAPKPDVEELLLTHGVTE